MRVRVRGRVVHGAGAAVVTVVVAAATAACSLGTGSAPPQGPAPAADAAVTATAYCGVRQVYWRGTWWRVVPPAARIRGEGVEREVTGAMTPTGPGTARLDSPGLAGPETLTDTGMRSVNQPPTPPCGL